MGARERTGQTGKRQPYRCFLIRCRLEEGAGPDGTAAWRFTVQQADAHAPRRTCVSLLEVAAHMETELASCVLTQEHNRSEREENDHALRTSQAGCRRRPGHTNPGGDATMKVSKRVLVGVTVVALAAVLALLSTASAQGPVWRGVTNVGHDSTRNPRFVNEN